MGFIVASSSPILIIHFRLCLICNTHTHIQIYTLSLAHHLNKSLILAALCDSFFSQSFNNYCNNWTTLRNFSILSAQPDFLCRFLINVKMKIKKTIQCMYLKSLVFLMIQRSMFDNFCTVFMLHTHTHTNNGCHSQNSLIFVIKYAITNILSSARSQYVKDSICVILVIKYLFRSHHARVLNFLDLPNMKLKCCTIW